MQRPEPVRQRSRTRRVLRGAALGFVVLLVCLALGVGVFVQSGRLNTWLRSEAQGAANAALAGDLAIGAIEGSVWRDFSLRDVELQWTGERVAWIREVRVVMALGALLRGELQIERIELHQPELTLRELPGGDWNLLRAVATAESEPSAEAGGLPFAIRLEALSLEEGSVEIVRLEAPPVRLDGITLAAAASLRDTALSALVRRVALTATSDGMPPLELGGALGIEDAGGVVVVRLDDVALSTAASSVTLSGELRPDVSSALKLEFAPLAATDLAALLPGTSPQHDVEGTLESSGVWRETHLAIALAAGEARLHGEGQLDLAQPELRTARADLQVSGADLRELLGRSDLAGIWSADLKVAEAAATGHVALAAGDGRAKLSGVAQLDASRGYDLLLELDALDLARVLPEEPQLAGALTLSATVNGSGFSADTLTGAANVTLARSRLGEVTVREGRAALRIDGGRLLIDACSLETDTASLALVGESSLASDGVLALDVTAGVREAAPWLALFGVEGGGRAELVGKLAGSPANARASGNLALHDFAAAGLELSTGTARFDFAGIGGPALEGSAEIELLKIGGPLPLDALDADLTARPGEHQEIALALHARGPDAVEHALKLEAKLLPNGVDARVHELQLDLPDGRWTLDAPTSLAQSAEALTIDPLVFSNNGASLRVAGRIAAAGAQDLKLTLTRLPLAALAPLFPAETEPTGEVDLDLVVAGSAASPQVTANLAIDALVLGGQPLEGLDAELEVREEVASLALALKQDAEHQLTVDGRVPVALRWRSGFEARALGAAVVRAKSAGIDLAFANGFLGDAASGLSGELEIDVELRGALEKLEPTGRLALHGVGVTPTALGVALHGIEADAVFSADALKLRSLHAEAGAGSFEARGEVSMQQFRPQALDASIALSDWPAIATRSYRVTAAGDVRAHGPLDALVVEGKLQVLEGTLRPELGALDDNALPRDETIEFEQPLDAAVAAQPPVPADGGPLPTAENVTLDLEVVVDRNLWVKHENASIELAGNLRARKPPGEPLAIVGAIETLRGWVNIQRRRFKIVEGVVTFTGGEEIDPSLDLLARYTVPSYRIDATVGGTASAPTFAMSSDPTLAQADILAVLLFGKPASELGEGQRDALTSEAAGFAASYGFNMLSQSVAESFGLADSPVQIEELSRDRVTLGGYLTEKTFVTVGQELGEEQGQRISVEYEFWPGWSIVTSSGTLGNNAAELRWKKRY